MLFDKKYTGKRYRYGLKSRPLDIGSVPDGWIIQSDREHKDYRFGTIDYPHRLTNPVAKSFQIERVS